MKSEQEFIQEIWTDIHYIEMEEKIKKEAWMRNKWIIKQSILLLVVFTLITLLFSFTFMQWSLFRPLSLLLGVIVVGIGFCVEINGQTEKGEKYHE